MNFKETVAFLFSMLPMYQRVGPTAYKKDLSNTRALLDALGNPQAKFKSVHIAGTNGKGTSAHAIAAILQLSGYRTGLYTSPHLVNFTERIKLDGIEISQEFVVKFVEQIRKQIKEIQPSFFEVTVAMAFAYFASEKVDIAVIETGLGGRLDSTNVINPEVSLITNIGMDHTDLLGDTLQAIAKEKAGIIKNETPIVLGKYQEEVVSVFEQKAAEMHALLIKADDGNVSLFGPEAPYYKRANEKGIVSVVQQLRKLGWEIPNEALRNGLKNFEKLTMLKGRFQVVQKNPTVIADVSHNEEGLSLLINQVKQESNGLLHIIFGSVRGKDLRRIFGVLPVEAQYYWTQSKVPRSLPATELFQAASSFGMHGHSTTNVNEALQVARKNAQRDDLILVTGSSFLVAEIEGL